MSESSPPRSEAAVQPEASILELPALPASTVRSDQDTATEPARYQCSLCHKQYDRLDHVKRHMFSHSNTRPFRCPQCPRRFNRRDLLNRHQLTAHESNSSARRRQTKRPHRAIQACEACITAKTKCDDKRPCFRCTTKGIICGDRPSNRRSALLAEDQENDAQAQAQALLAPPGPPSHEEPVDSNKFPSVTQNSDMSLSCAAPEQGPSTHMAMTGMSLATDSMILPDSELRLDNFDAPQLDGFDEDFWSDFAVHADLSQIYQDLDFQFGVTQDPLGSDYGHLDEVSIDQVLPENTEEDVSPRAPAATRHITNPAALGFEAFKRSPWLWTPANQDHAYAEHSQLAVNSEKILQSPQFSHEYQTHTHVLPEITTSAVRDEILAMALKFSKSSIKVRSFPSLRLLNILMQAFFVRENASIDPWIHESSFDPEHAPTPLLAAVIAAGSSFFAASNVWKMGLALQETVKLAICDALDEDNRCARQLETGQTFLCWIELGLWSGFRRKMEIGESFAHTVPTMLRRAGAFQSSHYTSMGPPDPGDEGQVLRQKWLDWINKESYKRLVFRLLINEMRSSIAFVRSPVFSSMELTLTLPSRRELWDAATPEEWKRKFLSLPQSRPTITLFDAMHDAARLEIDTDMIDLGISAHLTLYGLWGRVWSFLDTRGFQQRDASRGRKATNVLWSEAQHQELYTHMQKTKDKLMKLNALSPEADLVAEMLMMSLHVCSNDVQRFAGRYGEDEARAALPLLQDWVNRDEHRYAAWHAGQVLRAARTIPRTQLRGFLAIAVYHACLALWASSLMTMRANRSNMMSRRGSPGANTAAGGTGPPPGHHAMTFSDPHSASLPLTDPNLVVLDGDETPATRTYLAIGQGTPCLRLSNKVEGLHDPRVIAKVMMSIFRENFPAASEPLPPLLENLASLMDDLSKTPAR